MQQRQLVTLVVSPARQRHMMEKIMVVAPTTAVPITQVLAVALNVLPAPCSLPEILGALEVHVLIEVS